MSKDYYRRRWVKCTLRLKRYFCRKNSVPFDLIEEDILVPERCPVLGIELSINESRSSKDNSPSIDRIDPTLGYTKDNVIVISLKANRIKNNATFEEFEKVYLWFKSLSRQ